MNFVFVFGPELLLFSCFDMNVCCQLDGRPLKMAFFTDTYGHFSNWILEGLGPSLLWCSLRLMKRRCVHAVSVSVRHLLIVVSTSDDEVSLTHFSPPSFHFPGLPPSPQQLKAPGGVCRGGGAGWMRG